MKDLAEQLVGNLNEFLAFARGRLGEPELAADAVQESLLKALKSSGQIRDQSVKAWFYRILRRTIIDLYRRRDVQERAVEKLQLELDSPPSDDEERTVCACMESLMPGLKPEYSTLLRRLDLLDLNGEKVAPVATSLGITKNNLTVRLHRARQQLRERLEETCRVCATHRCLDCTCEIAPETRN
jgi:RNA polymerase sigma-70 factor (ECF subfamily)